MNKFLFKQVLPQQKQYSTYKVAIQGQLALPDVAMYFRHLKQKG